MKKMLSILLLAVLVLSLFAGCVADDETIAQEKAVEIAMEAVKADPKTATAHVHISSYEDMPCFSIHVYAGEDSYEVLIDAATGEVLNVGDASH